MKKYNNFNESKKSKKYCICKKTYTKWNSEENNIFNGLDPKNDKIFIEGEKYICTERLETMNGDYVILVYSNLKNEYPSEVKYKHEKFYADEYNDEEVKKWEEFMSKIVDTPLYKDIETINFLQKPRNNPYFGDYFEII